jgi:hypothetical protein
LPCLGCREKYQDIYSVSHVAKAAYHFRLTSKAEYRSFGCRIFRLAQLTRTA